MTEPDEPTDESTEDESTDETTEDEPDTFPRSYVEELRKEAGDNRTAAKAATEALDPLQRRLHSSLVAGTGRLADPTDLAFDAAHLDDDAALSAAIDNLLQRKPHLASRRVRDDVGQGAGEPADTFSLAGILTSRA